MRPGVVVVVGPRLKIGVSLLGVGPVLGVSPLAQGGLDKALGFAVGAWGVGPGAAVVESHRSSASFLGRPPLRGASRRRVERSRSDINSAVPRGRPV